MATLLFYDNSHTYTVDGEEVPSVSELTRFLSREIYSEAPQYVLDTAKQRGTDIHKATEALDKFGSVEVSDEYADYLRAYVAFTKDIKPEWKQIEHPIHNEKLYAGTLDRYGLMNGQNVIMDIKTTQTISGLHKVLYTAQLNLYKIAAQSNGMDVDSLWVLQLKKDGTYKLHQIEVDDVLALACLTMHEAIKNSKKRRKKT